MTKKRIESSKDFEIRKAAGIEIEEQRRMIGYDTKEYPLEYLVAMFGNRDTKKDDEDTKDSDFVVTAKFMIPDYQREEGIWSLKKKSLFIESLFLGIPIPFLFLYELEDGGLEIVDGVQRLSTIYTFIQGNLKLTGMDKLKKLEGFAFYDLTENEQRKFKNKSLRAIRLYAAGDTEDFRRDIIFARINRGGENLSSAEFRIGSFPGPFTDFVRSLSENEKFISLTPSSKEDRQTRFDHVLKILAYIDHYRKVGSKVATFLDDFLLSKQNDFNAESYRTEFEEMCNFIFDNIGEDAFKNKQGKATNGRVESISVGVALALRESGGLDTSKGFDWLHDTAFNDLVRGDGSNNKGRLIARIEFVKDQLLGDLNNESN